MNNIATFSEKKVALLNDSLRTNPFDPKHGRCVLSRQIAELDHADIVRCIQAMVTFNDFSEGNDPYGEHDFGGFTATLINGESLPLYFKIDYYDKDLAYLPENNRNNNDTVRVLTLMTQSEY